MSGALYLAWRYLAHHRIKTAILVLSVTLILFIPSGLQVLVDQSEARMRARAESTPLVVGAKGSPLELVLNSIYFAEDVPERMPFLEVARVDDTGYAAAIPLYARFRAGGDPIVGTTLDYFEFRGLEVADGRMVARIGDCVLGADVARRRGLGPGDAIVSSPETVFDLAGVYPLKMRVTGVFAPAGTVDDDAVFVDVKTAWVIEGLGHGHEDLSRPEAASRVLKREEGLVVGNASVKEYREIRDDTVDSYHFHGDDSEYPITAVLAVPPDHRSSTILQGEYLKDPEERNQILDPRSVLDELLGTVVQIKSYVITAFVLVGATTLATAALVFLLSLRLRRREIETMRKIGASRLHVTAVLLSEIVGVLLISLVLAAILTALTSAFGSEAVRALVR